MVHTFSFWSCAVCGGYIWNRQKKGDTGGSGEEKIGSSPFRARGTIFRLDVRIKRDVSSYVQRFVFSLLLRTCKLQLSTRRSIWIMWLRRIRERFGWVSTALPWTENACNTIIIPLRVCIYLVYYESRTPEESMPYEWPLSKVPVFMLYNLYYRCIREGGVYSVRVTAKLIRVLGV